MKRIIVENARSNHELAMKHARPADRVDFDETSVDTSHVKSREDGVDIKYVSGFYFAPKTSLVAARDPLGFPFLEIVGVDGTHCDCGVLFSAYTLDSDKSGVLLLHAYLVANESRSTWEAVFRTLKQWYPVDTPNMTFISDRVKGGKTAFSAVFRQVKGTCQDF